MKRIVTALILIPVVLALVFKAPVWLFTLLVGFLALLCAWEFLGLASERGTARPPRIATLISLVLLFAGSFYRPDQTFNLFGALSILLLVYCMFMSPIQRVLADSSAAIVCLIYTGLTLTTLPTLRAQSNGISLIVFLLFVVWAGDITALYVGKTWGRHKMSPRLSPNKTWEGTLGSVFGSVAVAGLLILFSNLLITNLVLDSFFEKLSVHIFYSGEPWHWMMIALIVNIAAQLGDLLESAFKRGAGVKDSGTLLPGHGGMLDRVDALLLAAPVLWYMQVLQQFFN
jgi:phosphatidate cytidylyltransferase